MRAAREKGRLPLAPASSERLEVQAGGNRTLDVLVLGLTGSTPLVFHSGTPNGLLPLPDALDPRWQLGPTVLYARPGYCASTPQPGRSVADGASDTARILDALGFTTFTTVGWVRWRASRPGLFGAPR